MRALSRRPSSSPGTSVWYESAAPYPVHVELQSNQGGIITETNIGVTACVNGPLVSELDGMDSKNGRDR